MSKTQVTSVGAFSDSHTFDLQSFRGPYRPHHIFLREHRSKGNEERKPYSVYSKRSQYHDERNMKDFPVFWDGSYLYQFLVAIWRSYKMLWLVGRKITVKGLSIIVMMFVDKDQNIYVFFMGVWKSLHKLYQLNICD